MIWRSALRLLILAAALFAFGVPAEALVTSGELADGLPPSDGQESPVDVRSDSARAPAAGKAAPAASVGEGVLEVAYDSRPGFSRPSDPDVTPPDLGWAGSTVTEQVVSVVRRVSELVAPSGLADDVVVVRGGQSPVPAPGEVFSGAYGSTIDDAAAYVPHGSIRTSTVGEIRAGGGTVDVVPELTRSGVLNTRHVNICLGPGTCPFPDEFIPNPVPKPGRIQ